jgi:bifunctional non-homologous end joining protein LigD
MLFDLGPCPTDDDHLWAYEIKYDGWRGLVGVDVGDVRVVTRGRRNIVDELPELAPLGRALGRRRAILDGELVSFGADGRPDFDAVQARLFGRRSTRSRGAPIAFMAFDLLHLDGRNLCPLPYEERRAELARLGLVERARDKPAVSSWGVSSYVVGGGAQLVALTRQRRLEGIVCKRLGSSYVPGQRVKHWRKIVHRERCTVVIGGFVPDGNAAASLLVGEHDAAGNLVYLGRIQHAIGRELADVLRKIERPRSPFLDGPPRAVFVEPRLTVEIERLGFQPTLRHARLVGFPVDTAHG